MTHCTGTNCFASRAALLRYYRNYGYKPADIDRKLKQGEVRIGIPECNPGETYYLDDDYRYIIRCK